MPNNLIKSTETNPTKSIGVKRPLTDKADEQEPTKKLQTFEEPPWD